ncbi:MAG: hypothetical protein HGB11_14695 [Chlorobiales bacterium]|nr:hypothetical protein [Chlorobiales bacterium]
MSKEGIFSKVLSGIGLKKKQAPILPPIIEDEALIRTMKQYDAVRDVCFSPDGKMVAGRMRKVQQEIQEKIFNLCIILSMPSSLQPALAKG